VVTKFFNRSKYAEWAANGLNNKDQNMTLKDEKFNKTFTLTGIVIRHLYTNTNNLLLIEQSQLGTIEYLI